MKNIAVFASGTGTNFIAIYEAIQKQEINANLAFFFSDKIHSKSLEIANTCGLHTLGLRLKDFDNKEVFEERIVKALKEAKIDLIVLAGYMKIIGPTLLNAYQGKIINIHPSLLPAYRGKDAIIRQHHDQVSPMGISIHYVDQGVDTGKVIFQKSIDVTYPITLHEVETMIHEIEHRYYKKVIKQIIEEMDK